MKSGITTILALLFLCQLSFAQQKIAVVDLEKTIQDWNTAVRLDDILHQKKEVFKILLEDWLDKLQHKYDAFDNIIGTPSQQTTLAEELWSDQDEILAFERIIIDSIPAYRREVLQLIRSRIQETIDAVAKANNYDLVIAKDNILFNRGESIDELIVISTEIDLKPIKEKVELIDKNMAGQVEYYTSRIEQY